MTCNIRSTTELELMEHLVSLITDNDDTYVVKETQNNYTFLAQPYRDGEIHIFITIRKSWSTGAWSGNDYAWIIITNRHENKDFTKRMKVKFTWKQTKPLEKETVSFIPINTAKFLSNVKEVTERLEAKYDGMAEAREQEGALADEIKAVFPNADTAFCTPRVNEDGIEMTLSRKIYCGGEGFEADISFSSIGTLEEIRALLDKLKELKK